jgi:DNA polymerase
MPETEPNPDLVAILAWYKAMGVDAAVAGEAVDWLAHGDTPPGAALASLLSRPRTAPQLPTPAQPPALTAARPSIAGAPARPLPPGPVPRTAEPRPVPVAPPDEAVMAARTAARSARSLEELEANLRGFEGCGLKASAKSTCFYRGSPAARLLIIGEAPGRDEDLEGKPFVGKAGQMLDLMLKAIGLSEADVHITNVVYWRPPGNRTPTPQEVLACRPFLDRQIELVAPEFVMLAGGAAAKAVLGIDDGIMKIRGKWRDMVIGQHSVKTMATLHPAYLLRTPAAKRLAWRDLLAVKAALSGLTAN